MIVKKMFGRKWIFEGYLPGEQKQILEGIAVQKKVFEGKSVYQTIDIFDTFLFGRVLFLDGLTQLSTAFEAVYHEMLVHPALCSLKKPSRVLIIGGGDGGTLREVLKHSVQEVHMVEIDQMVVNLAKKYFPQVCKNSFEDPRVHLIIADGGEYIKKYKNYFDCIILDSNDPDGNMAKKLFTKEFLQNVKAALQYKGMFASQTGYVSDAFGKNMRQLMRKVFSFVQVRRAFVRCFPLDEHSFSFASVGFDCSHIGQKAIERVYRKRDLQSSYYSSSIHFTSSVLPKSFT